MSEAIITKNAIGDSLRKLMETKPFEKITISDITNACGLNRLTFYYHFQDKFELLDWIINNEIIEPFSDGLNFDNFIAKFSQVFTIMKNNEAFYRNALKYSDSEFQRYIFKVSTKQFRQVIKDVIERSNYEMGETEEVFISEFFGYGITGVVLDWAQKGMKATPQELATNLEYLVNDCKKMAIDRYFGNI